MDVKLSSVQSEIRRLSEDRGKKDKSWRRQMLGLRECVPKKPPPKKKEKKEKKKKRKKEKEKKKKRKRKKEKEKEKETPPPKKKAKKGHRDVAV
jgi:hypothetical protein